MTAAGAGHAYVAKETLVSMLVAGFAPALLGGILNHGGNAVAIQPVRDAAHALAPQFLAGGFMSALAPSLLTWRRFARGRTAPESFAASGLVRIAATAVLLAIGSTIVTLALIHAATTLLTLRGLGGNAVGLLGAGQSALAAAVVTPAALTLLFQRREAVRGGQ